MTRRRIATAAFARTTSRLTAGALALALPRVAAAEPHKLLVLQSEGRADPAIRARIDSAIARLAIAAEPLAAPGELTYTDAATAVGCSKPDAPSCKDDVLGMLSVDEIVITTVTPKPGGLEIAVQRVVKGGASRDATMLLPTGAAPDKLDGIAPLFGDTTTGPATTGSATSGPATTGPGSDGTAPAASGAAISATQPGEPPAIPVATPPSPQPGPAADSATPFDAGSSRDRKLEIGGMIGGGSAVVLGLLLWAGANSTETEINTAPTRTQSDLNHLRDLESRGDFYATAGNVLVATGALVGGLATYLYIRDRRSASAATARLTPTLLPHGVGLVLRFGGSP